MVVVVVNGISDGWWWTAAGISGGWHPPPYKTDSGRDGGVRKGRECGRVLCWGAGAVSGSGCCVGMWVLGYNPPFHTTYHDNIIATMCRSRYLLYNVLISVSIKMKK